IRLAPYPRSTKGARDDGSARSSIIEVVNRRARQLCAGGSSAISPDDATLGGVVGRDLDVYLVTGEDADDPPPSHPARGTRHDFEATFDLHLEGGVTKHLFHGPPHADVIVVSQRS